MTDLEKLGNKALVRWRITQEDTDSASRAEGFVEALEHLDREMSELCETLNARFDPNGQ